MIDDRGQSPHNTATDGETDGRTDDMRSQDGALHHIASVNN